MSGTIPWVGGPGLYKKNLDKHEPESQHQAVLSMLSTSSSSWNLPRCRQGWTVACKLKEIPLPPKLLLIRVFYNINRLRLEHPSS